jgi:polyhydroxyalkanoate synthesis regulator protein
MFNANHGDVAVNPILVKRYDRSRLYDTAEGRYVSVDDLRQWQRDGIAFYVRDAETGEDITLILLA